MFDQSEEKVNKAKEEANQNVERIVGVSEKMEKMSRENFTAWREELHKYYAVVLAIISGSGILSKFGLLKVSSNNYDIIFWGVFVSLIGLFIGFFFINLYFYFDRKCFRIEGYLEMTEPYNLYNHPDVAGNNIMLAMKLNLKEIIKKNKQKLEEIIEDREKRRLEALIKGDKALIKRLKYWGGGQGGILEKLWIIGVISSLVFTFSGMVIIFVGIIK